MRYSLKALTADELSFKVNPIRITQDTKFEIKPFYSRQIRQRNDNPKIHLVMLECKIESTEEAPKPFNLIARFVGVFEVEDVKTEDDKRLFALNATETMYPYLRAAITNLTADALINPLTLPVVSGATLFPDDRGKDQYTLSFDPSVIN